MEEHCWEKIESFSSSYNVHRMRVPGGWLYCTSHMGGEYGSCVAQTFVPDRPSDVIDTSSPEDQS